VQLAHLLAQLDRMGKGEVSAVAVNRRIETEVRGEAAPLALSPLREVAKAHVGARRRSGHGHRPIPSLEVPEKPVADLVVPPRNPPP
jgi:hypothetical protein